MAYIPRLANDAPSAADKLWIQKGSGGYNPCIYARGNSVLPNCFTGDTEIITKDGPVRLDSIVNKEIEVLSKDNVYRKAIGGYYGLQPIYRIDFTNGQSFRCTANHRWVVIHENEYIFKTTIELTDTDEIPCTDGITFMRSVHPLGHSLPVFCIEEPETHTMVLKGGILTGQCVGYAYGRFMEILGTTSCKLSTDNAGLWFGHTQDGYERGQTPQLGAVICWRNPGKAGHVAIVEQINADGSIVTSNSAWNSTRYYVQTLYPPGYTWSSNYILQGFIYNPNAPQSNGSKIAGFIEAATSNIGKFLSDIGITTPKATGAFVNYCAKDIPDLLGVVIPNDLTPSSFCSSGIGHGLGSFVPGPLFKAKPTPEPGDIVLLRTDDTKNYKKRYECDTLAIVSEVIDDSVYVVTVANNSMIVKSVYKTNYNAICGYYRPKWVLVENSTTNMIGYGKLGQFYDTKNTDEDATVREVAYTNGTDILPPVQDMQISVINYTTLLASFMDDLLVPCSMSGNIGSEVSVEGISNPTAKIVIQHLMSKGLNKAAACAVAGNIQRESNFNAGAKGDYVGGVPTSFGLCQWHYERGAKMKQMAGANWETNVTGQLDFLWSELQTGYSQVLSVLTSVPDNPSGVYQAVQSFVYKFEIPADLENEVSIRVGYANAFYSALVVQMTTTSSGSSTVNPNSVLSGTTVEIPSSVNQSTINSTYTNYTYWFSRWAKSSVQNKIAQLWDQKGRKSNRNIATIDGFYLIAVKPIFGTNGDKVSVVLSDGTVFNAIIADIKGNENGVSGAAKFGHSQSGKINVIEWEGVGSATSAQLGQSIDLTMWSGKTVAKIINGGSIL